MGHRSTIVTAALSLALALAACGGGGDGETAGAGDAPAATTTTVDLDRLVKTYPVSSRDHVQTAVEYPHVPPVGGEHNALWQNCGFYREPILSELAVHSLEHGAVWIVHRPGLPADQVERLRQLTRGRTHVLVSPWVDASLPTPVVASAWGLQLQVESAGDPALAQFVAKYVGGPQTPEPGARCNGSFGTPE